jgi:hypothetical protein
MVVQRIRLRGFERGEFEKRRGGGQRMGKSWRNAPLADHIKAVALIAGESEHVRWRLDWSDLSRTTLHGAARAEHAHQHRLADGQGEERPHQHRPRATKQRGGRDSHSRGQCSR